jgi:hypothetical protein
MKRMILAVALAALAAAPASAATLWVGHGINGLDLGQKEATLPVDICLVTDGTPAKLFADVPFKAFAKIDADLAAGRYDVEVRLATTGDSVACDGPVAIAASVFLGFGENATAFAHLNEQGVPTLTKFTNDVRELGSDQTRLYARHAAAFGDVNVYLRNHHKKVLIRDLENPDQEGADLPAGTWYVAIYPSSSWHKPAFSARLPLAAGTAYFAYAVGTPANGTFDVLVQPLELN